MSFDLVFLMLAAPIALAFLVGIIYMAPDHRGSGQSGEHA